MPFQAIQPIKMPISEVHREWAYSKPIWF